MKTPVTKQDWIDALTKAKKGALERYPDRFCIAVACERNEITWGENCTFNECGRYENRSLNWIREKSPSREEVAAVFDNSIQLIKEM